MRQREQRFCVFPKVKAWILGSGQIVALLFGRLEAIAVQKDDCWAESKEV